MLYILQRLDPVMKTALLLLIASIMASLCYGSLGLFYWWLWGWRWHCFTTAKKGKELIPS